MLKKKLKKLKKTIQKCVKRTKTIFEKVRKALGNMSALTSEKGLVFLGSSCGTSEFDKNSEFCCFWSANRESVKELIYQKKNGGHQASKRVISHNASKQPPTSGVGTLYIP